MTIAAHIASSTTAGAQQNFRFYLLSFLAAKHPEHHFIFIFDRPFDPTIIAQKNITPVLLGPPVKNNLLRHYWYNFKIPSVLNRYQVGVFFTNGICCSLRTNVPQCMLIPDLSFLEPRNEYPAADAPYTRRYFKKFTNKATHIVVHNSHIAAAIKKMDHSNANKIHVIPGGGSFTPAALSAAEADAIKLKYAAGVEYFIAFISSTTMANTVPLLKAFSAFKKRQRSNMQLLLLVSPGEMEKLQATLANYKYRDEVKPVETNDEQLASSLVAASYAAFYLPSPDRFENSGTFAYRNHIPLITANSDFQRSMYGDAALYIDPNEKDISEKMMLIYKDENLRKAMADCARAGAASFSIEEAAGKLWDALAGTALQKL